MEILLRSIVEMALNPKDKELLSKLAGAVALRGHKLRDKLLSEEGIEMGDLVVFGFSAGVAADLMRIQQACRSWSLKDEAIIRAFGEGLYQLSEGRLDGYLSEWSGGPERKNSA